MKIDIRILRTYVNREYARYANYFWVSFRIGGQVEPIILTPEERADMESAIEMAGRDLDCDPAVERPNEPP